MSISRAFVILLISSVTACSAGRDEFERAQDNTAPPTSSREESVAFFARIYKAYRDTERSIYQLQYDIRDGVDSFIYDAQKDYYKDYQK